MKKYLIASLLILTAGIALDAKPEVRFKEKGITAKYDSKQDAMIYTAKWDNKWSGQKNNYNPLTVKIIEYGDKGQYPNTAWLQVTIEHGGNVYIGMNQAEFFYDTTWEKIDLKRAKTNVDLSIGFDTFTDFWGQQTRGQTAKEWANRFIKLGNSGDLAGIRLDGDTVFYDSYTFTKKDKESLRKLGEVWLKYFLDSNP